MTARGSSGSSRPCRRAVSSGLRRSRSIRGRRGRRPRTTAARVQSQCEAKAQLRMSSSSNGSRTHGSLGSLLDREPPWRQVGKVVSRLTQARLVRRGALGTTTGDRVAAEARSCRAPIPPWVPSPLAAPASPVRDAIARAAYGALRASVRSRWAAAGCACRPNDLAAPRPRTPPLGDC